MKCQDYYCLLLGMTSCDHDAKSSVCRPQAAVAPGPRAAVSVSGSWPGWFSPPAREHTCVTSRE
jgi:hypothetical protein